MSLSPFSFSSSVVSAMNSSKTLRGHNKPRCIKCGSVARSRCPFQSCKKCCAESQNPCHIHVLKPNATFPDKSPTSGSTLSEQPSTEASPSGSTHRIASLRQLSNSFAQFNNLQTPMRSRRPLTNKEAAVLNEWRFQKLKDYKEGIIDMENEAFDRYMQNISLLEEVLTVNNPKPEGPIDDVSPIPDSDSTSVEDSNKMMLSSLRLKQRSNPTRSENLRKRVQAIVDHGLKKLRKFDLNPGDNEPNKQNELSMKDERFKFLSAEKESSMNDLLDRLSKARNEEDLKSCLDIKSHLFGRHRGESLIQTEGDELSTTGVLSENDTQLQSDYSSPKWLSTGSADQDALLHIDSRYSSLEGIESL